MVCTEAAHGVEQPIRNSDTDKTIPKHNKEHDGSTHDSARFLLFPAAKTLSDQYRCTHTESGNGIGHRL